MVKTQLAMQVERKQEWEQVVEMIIFVFCNETGEWYGGRMQWRPRGGGDAGV